MTEPGDLNRRLVLEAPVETPDGAGGVTRDYQSITTLWAQVIAVRSRTEIAADSFGGLVTHRIVIRATRTLTTLNRLRDGAQVFRVVAYRDAPNRRFIEIDAEERED